jgi:hypothetical protein
MYKPKFNSVLVQIDDEDAKWGTGNDESMLGKSYSKGKVVEVAKAFPHRDYPVQPTMADLDLTGQDIMWNEGAEAGTTFEEDGKLYGMIYWWDIRGVKE